MARKRSTHAQDSVIGTLVQGVLSDTRLTPAERGEEAALVIDRYVRERDDIPVNVALPIPPEWEHRLPEPRVVLNITTEAPVEQAPRKRWWKR